MTTAKKLLSTQTGEDKLYVDDVFSTYLYTGNDSTQTINNGIDLAGKGGMVWFKSRINARVSPLVDSVRGVDKYIYSDQTSASSTSPAGTDLTSFNSNGFSLGKVNNFSVNYDSKIVSWTFRKAPKFFDVVTYTGDGTSNRQIAHGLGAEPGFITTKSTSTTGNWNSYHRSATGDMKLNTQDAQTGSRAIITAADSSTFTVSGVANTNGVSYVAYLWAHDDSEDGFIQCGSFTIGGSFKATVNLGREPQYLIIKSATGGNNWSIFDTTRGITSTALGNSNVGANDAEIYANDSQVERTGNNPISLSYTGFEVDVSNLSGNNLNSTFIYLAIRRPNKPPTTGTEVYNAIARTGTGTATTVTGVGFAPDLIHVGGRTGTFHRVFSDRLRGPTQYLDSTTTDIEANGGGNTLIAFGMDGVVIGGSQAYFNYSGYTYINHFFRRAPGFFDVVCYSETSNPQTINHSLGVVPEMMIHKIRTEAGDWRVWHKDINRSQAYPWPRLNGAEAGMFLSEWVPASTPTATTFSVDYQRGIASRQHVAYLFATLPGVSKVGSYTGNGTSLSVECGFSTGARFILVKSVDDVGDWFVWDTARGIVAANDPHISLNTTTAEVTADDSVDPYVGGFIVNQNTATNINIAGKRYIFLAIA